LQWEGSGRSAQACSPAGDRNFGASAHRSGASCRTQQIAVVRARDDASLGGRTLASLVPEAWTWRASPRITAIPASLRQGDRALSRGGQGHALDPAQAFIVRTLLIHEYRRVLLRDAQLPPALLPLDWPGVAAYALCRDFYRLTTSRS
jgi:phenylacetic acid degradation operon negative regulatory protein